MFNFFDGLRRIILQVIDKGKPVERRGHKVTDPRYMSGGCTTEKGELKDVYKVCQHLASIDHH